jgi:hypothetical protein
MATTLIGKELYVKNGVLTVEYFDAPDISSQNHLTGIGYHLGTVTKENVPELTGGTNKFMEVTKGTDKFYLIYDATKMETRKATTTATGQPSTLDKVVSFATSIFDFLGKVNKSTSTGTTGGTTTTGGTDSGSGTGSGGTDSPPQTGNSTLDWLKNNWLWFMPSVVLIPVLIYLAIKKWSRPSIQLSQPKNQ